MPPTGSKKCTCVHRFSAFRNTSLCSAGNSLDDWMMSVAPAVNHAHAGSRLSIDDGGGGLNHPLSFNNCVVDTTLSQVLDCFMHDKFT